MKKSLKIVCALALLILIIVGVGLLSSPNTYEVSVRNDSSSDIDWVDIRFDTGMRPPVGVLSAGTSATTQGVTQTPKQISIIWKFEGVSYCKKVLFIKGFPKGFPGRISSSLMISFKTVDDFSISMVDAKKQKTISWGGGHSMKMATDFKPFDLNGIYKTESCSSGA